MDSREISARLHDILRTACRVRAPGPGRSADAGIESIDQVKARLRALIADLGDQEAPRLPPRLQPSAADFPEGRIPGTRAIVQHRRRTRGVSPVSNANARKHPPRSGAPLPADVILLPDPRSAAESLFRRPSLVAEPARATISAC